MENPKKLGYVIPLTILYSCIWVGLLFMIVGFFMPTPVMFSKKIQGKRTRRRPETKFKQSTSDELTDDDILFYDIVDDD